MTFLFLFFHFIKSETSDSFVTHFDGHFAYLKTLDFYFKGSAQIQPAGFTLIHPCTERLKVVYSVSLNTQSVSVGFPLVSMGRLSSGSFF